MLLSSGAVLSPLSNNPSLIKPLTDSSREHLHEVVNRLASPPSEQWARFLRLVLRAGSESNELGFLHRGLIRFFYATPDGKEFNKTFVAEGGFLGAYSAYLTKSPARFSIQALEDCDLLRAPYDKVLKLYDSHACWMTFG